MNHYQYQRRVPQRKKTDYIKPIIIAVIFIAILFGLWKLLGLFFGGDTTNDETLASIQVEVESGSTEILTSNSNEWEEITVNSVQIFEGEALKTSPDGRLTLELGNGESIRLNKNSEIEVTQLDKNGIELSLKDGDLWVDTTKAIGDELKISTKFLSMDAGNGARFSINTPGDIFVINGKVDVDVVEKNEGLRSLTVNADQQLSVNQSIVNDIADGLEKDILFALDSDFKKSSWYQWNAKKDGIDENGSEASSEDDEDTNNEDQDENQDDEDTAEEGEDEAFMTPKITEPGANGDKVTLDSTEQFIKGTVSSATEAVYVNDYKLQQFKAGNTNFTYRANTDIGNLKTGKNEYEIIAEDKDGNQSNAATITLILPQNLTEEEDEDDSEDSEASGELNITQPNGGNDLSTSETSFILSGSVPSNASKVMVNKYQLQGFKKGDESFSYNANTGLGTLKVGSNSYTVEAFDENGNSIGTDSMIITVNEEAENKSNEASEQNQDNNQADLTLSINLPTTAINYETTLNQITLGGSVSTSAEAVYVNNQKISYNPGSSNWDHVVDLQAGENTFNIFAEKAGQKVLLDSIKVIYNQ